jgi:hypothetical protein
MDSGETGINNHAIYVLYKEMELTRNNQIEKTPVNRSRGLDEK